MIRKFTIPRSSIIALAAVALINLLGASDCARVENSVTAPGSGDALSAPARTECVELCNRAARVALFEENAVHDQNLRECSGNRECLQQEAQRHAEAKQRIRDRFNECVESCHDQGGGSGGQ
jgi:hypothetical protein